METINILFLTLMLLLVFLAIIIIVALFLEKSPKQREYQYPPQEINPRLIGGCVSTRWGCCPDGITGKEDIFGSNCTPLYQPIYHYEQRRQTAPMLPLQRQQTAPMLPLQRQQTAPMLPLQRQQTAPMLPLQQQQTAPLLPIRRN